jgi:hypothetical protein
MRLPGLNIPKLLRRPINLPAVILCFFLLACWLAWLTYRAQTQQQAIAVIEKYGGTIQFDDLLNADGELRPWDERKRPQWQQTLMLNLGADFVQKPRWVRLSLFSGPAPSPPRIDEAVWNAIPRLPDVARVEFSHAGLGGTDLKRLQQLPRLKRLTFVNCRISDQGLAQLGELKQLVWLDMAGSEVSGASLACLGNLQRLKYLRLSHTRIGDTEIAQLSSLSNLGELNLNGTQITDMSVMHLKRLSGLKDLWLQRTRLSHKAIQDLQQAKPELIIHY